MKFADNADPDGSSLSSYRSNGCCSICQRIKNVQIRLHGCARWSGPSLFPFRIRAFLFLDACPLSLCNSADCSRSSQFASHLHQSASFTIEASNFISALMSEKFVAKVERKKAAAKFKQQKAKSALREAAVGTTEAAAVTIEPVAGSTGISAELSESVTGSTTEVATESTETAAESTEDTPKLKVVRPHVHTHQSKYFREWNEGDENSHEDLWIWPRQAKSVFEHAQNAQVQNHPAHAHSHLGICSPMIWNKRNENSHEDLWIWLRQAKKCLQASAKCTSSASSQACAKPYLGICSPKIHSIVSNYSVSGQRKPWSDCADAQSDLGLLCPHMLRHVFAWRDQIIRPACNWVNSAFFRKPTFHMVKYRATLLYCSLLWCTVL